MTITRTVTIDADRRPLGYYTWVATFRDGTRLIEFETDCPQLSFDRVTERNDLIEVCLIPYIPGDPRSHIRIQVAPGERVEKVWTRTFTKDLDSGEELEGDVIDTFVLISNKPVYHYCFHDGSMIITTNREL
jgi:hypothetical protein